MHGLDRILPVTLAALAVPLLAAPTAPAQPPRPNIVLILADDLGHADVGFHGRAEWATPNLDRLAASGLTFRRFYAASPVCAPSRAALLTGKATLHNGVRRNEDDLPAAEVTIAEALKPLGYATAAFGKWHHGKPRPGAKSFVHPLDQGFDRFFGFLDATHAWEKFPTNLWDGRERTKVDGYADDLFTDRAVAFIAEDRQQPFFLYVPFTAPHFDIEAPDDELARHRGKFSEPNPDVPLNAAYAAQVTRLDRNVGRILEALAQKGLTDSTLVVFASDNGATFEMGNQGTSAFHDSNRPFRGQKRTVWEGGLRVPALAVWPGHIAAGRVEPAPVLTTDLFPTLLALAGGRPDPAWRLDGLDVSGAWTTGSAVPDRTLCFEWQSEGTDQLAALRGRHKLVVGAGAKPELYDVEADPAERRDLSAQFPQVARQLREELEAWRRSEISVSP